MVLVHKFTSPHGLLVYGDNDEKVSFDRRLFHASDVEIVSVFAEIDFEFKTLLSDVISNLNETEKLIPDVISNIGYSTDVDKLIKLLKTSESMNKLLTHFKEQL